MEGWDPAQLVTTSEAPDLLDVWGSFKYNREQSSVGMFDTSEACNKASGSQGSYMASIENGLQELVQSCPGAQQIIAREVAEHVAPRDAIQRLIETHWLVAADNKNTYSAYIHMRLSIDNGKFRTKWNVLDQLECDGKLRYRPSHDYIVASVIVNPAMDAAQIIYQRLVEHDGELRFFATCLLRFSHAQTPEERSGGEEAGGGGRGEGGGRFMEGGGGGGGRFTEEGGGSENSVMHVFNVVTTTHRTMLEADELAGCQERAEWEQRLGAGQPVSPSPSLSVCLSVCLSLSPSLYMYTYV